jgi:hypothetical protein
MANLRMTLLNLLNKDEQSADPSFLRDGVRLLAKELMDAEVTQLAGAGLHERSESRLDAAFPGLSGELIYARTRPARPRSTPCPRVGCSVMSVPQKPVRTVALELTVDQICGRGHVREPAETGADPRYRGRWLGA